jgi:diadenosine tetraphosphate (Ap4A) HIT family hydrolase
LESCPFCDIPASRVRIETEHAFAVASPLAEGHVLVAPRKHVSSVYELTMPEQKALSELVGGIRSRLIAGLKPDGLNMGFSYGLAAGQTAMHARVHVIPRRQGDVPDPRGAIRWVLADNASYRKKQPMPPPCA